MFAKACMTKPAASHFVLPTLRDAANHGTLAVSPSYTTSILHKIRFYTTRICFPTTNATPR